MQSYTILQCSYHNLQHCCNSVNIYKGCKTYAWAVVMASVSALLLQHLPYKLVLKSSDLHAPVFLKGQTKLEWQ